MGDGIVGDMNRLLRRTIGTALVALLILGVLPGAASAAVNDPPVAVDDPGVACGGTDTFGGGFPIPEDFRSTFDPESGSRSSARVPSSSTTRTRTATR